METTDGDDCTSKAEDKDPPPSPYSVETPYGFHLDLDFLKYVDDIEKGHTIKRIPIHRKTKYPKFSTLPRNFSLPENGSRAYSSSQNKSFLKQRKSSLGAGESTFPVTPTDSSPYSGIPNEPSYRRKALLIETIRQDPVKLEEETGNCRGRPQLLRASSMPATLPPSQNSEEETLLTFLPSCDAKSSEINISPAKESLEFESFKETSLTASEGPWTMKQKISKMVLDNEREKAQLMLDQKQAAKARMHPSASWEGQLFVSQELLVVTESGEEECDAAEMNTCLPPVQSGSTSSMALEYSLENQIHEEIELSICETVPEVLEEDEVTHADTRQIEENLNLEPLPSEEPSKIIALRQHIAILEEQLNNKTEELEQIRVVLKQQDKEIKAKEKSIEMLASSKAELEEKLCGESTKEIQSSTQAKDVLQYHDAAVNTELVQEKLAKEAYDKGINVSITVPMESVGCDVCEVDNKNSQVKEIDRNLFHVSHKMSSIPVCVQEKDSPSFQKQIETEQCNDYSTLELSYRELKIDEHADNYNSQKETYIDASSQENSSSVGTINSKAERNQCIFQDFKQEESHQEPKDSPADPSVGQYVKKIQDLLQEQWMCLENGYPELASAIKHPASKLSSIQNQLVNSLNLLLSAYSTPTPRDKENSNTQYQQLEISPSTSLKSIMKKKDTGYHAGGNGTKKTLQFVGVNGGYETTSSEDSSCEETSSEGNSDSETERKYGNEEHRQQDDGNEDDKRTPGTSQFARQDDTGAEELEGPLRGSVQTHKAERFKPSADFLKGCQILSKHLPEIRNTKDKLLRHVLSTICQEWFRISSRKSSSPEIVAAYLQDVETIHPQLQNIIVNLADGNGNTALHYSVSHSNFQIVKLLLDTGVCDVDHQNKAGYTAVMITPLASAETDEEMEVVTKLLREGNVNIRASQGGQTALILGVSHDREDMVKALLSCGADINLQDDAGLSPLMVASQYGNMEIVKLLLDDPACDTTLTDMAGNSALSMALKSAHIEIAEILQAHKQHSRPLNT
ncbi:KN motif and ankyrin repeat domain-containing protein 4 [Sceloporus undulatus]|uniref:KN motif and ankyrin repeat domain-containing protein 4 n=1 Tax=Sceloporus undulatus TaxID=8520 RepID=UPI001C4B2F5E|nr:KN motif and ankyrin repeat domain-containing protein 4 [Sceloporus undulatus]XP_042317229.1 KN motif and ankyrin repeat domain-containing protein 4 [Sceloporus undulatus]XP_042317230.1 KN motif and ankyrin repeat domain-containing protein 4 [Sceloporus undulatus]XP_042317231.1 KN motif and ankyrin repeat domain-containing protein 4 [Sceloporus undulatus]XP_042317232.1 KN motif and ankyrin repeat domain-containing protein 4 [Sceloporus undulatus]XP_042317233.1 KN motif and ankyrin repeat do